MSKIEHLFSAAEIHNVSCSVSTFHSLYTNDVFSAVATAEPLQSPQAA
jgi:hypothetical protein